MGWNSWGHFKSGVSAGLLAEVADAMVSLGLRDAGCECGTTLSAALAALAAPRVDECSAAGCSCWWVDEYVNTDDGWLQTNRTAGGQLAPEPGLFPHGYAPLLPVRWTACMPARELLTNRCMRRSQR